MGGFGEQAWRGTVLWLHLRAASDDCFWARARRAKRGGPCQRVGEEARGGEHSAAVCCGCGEAAVPASSPTAIARGQPQRKSRYYYRVSVMFLRV